MKALKLKPALLAAAVLSVSAYTGVASAHCANETLLSGSQNVDLYRVRCMTGDGSPEAPSILPTDKLHVRVLKGSNTAASNGVYAQIGREGFRPSTMVSDASFTAATSCANMAGASGWARLEPNDPVQQPGTTAVNGNGDYNFAITRNSATATNYSVEFHCSDSTVGGTPTPASHTITTEVVNLASELPGSTALSPDVDLEIDN